MCTFIIVGPKIVHYDGCNFTALTEVPYASFRYSYTHSREILKRLLHFRPLLFPLPPHFSVIERCKARLLR